MADPSSASGDFLFDWLALERIPRVGPLTIARLYSAFGDPRAAMKARAVEIRRRTGLSEKLAGIIADFTPPEDEIKKDMDLLQRLDVRVVTRWAQEYPPSLQEIHDPPALLFVRGTLSREDYRAVAIVGARNPTRYGLEMTELISRALARSGITLVSGLARGIDTACHKTALAESGRTIGVLGCGIDVPYPKENTKLVEEMVRSGAVMSEFRPGTAPLATNFYRRNRIVSGLTKGVVVVQATRNSGSLITAHHALDQNRDVFAVPGNALNARSWGPHHLIKQGAGLVESAEDVLEALFGQVQGTVQSDLFGQPAARGDALSEAAQRVVDSLDPDPVPIDVLCEALRMEAGKLSGILLELELNGLVRQYPGKMFARVLR